MTNVDITGKVKTSPHLYFYSKTPPLFLCRFMVDSDSNLFPILCFYEKAKEIVDKIHIDDKVRIQGTLEDFRYNDCNLANHVVKILLASSVELVTKECFDTFDTHMENKKMVDVYNQMVGSGYEILNFNEKQMLIS